MKMFPVGADNLLHVAEVRAGGAPTIAATQTPEEHSEPKAKEGTWKSKAGIATRIPAELKRRLDQAVYNLQGPPHCLTVTALIEQALEAEISRLEQEHGPWKYEGKPRTGRPWKP